MPATVVAILKNIGESVKAGDRLIVLEAMKMEHTIHAPVDGILKKFFTHRCPGKRRRTIVNTE